MLHFVFTFLACFYFVGLFMLRGDTFIVLYVSCFNCLLIYIYELFIDICLYCVLVEIKNLFCLLVFSTHAVIHFVQCFRIYIGSFNLAVVYTYNRWIVVRIGFVL